MKRAYALLCLLVCVIAAIGWQDIPGEFLQRARNWATDFGAVGNGTTDDTARLTAMILALENYETLVLRKPVDGGYYKITTPITIDKPLRIVGDGNMPEIRQTVEDQHLFLVTSDNVTIEGIKLRGPQSTNQNDVTESAIRCFGSSAASPRRNLKVLNCEITTFGGEAVDLKWVEDFEVRGNRITDINYAGVLAQSVLRGVIADNRITNIVGASIGYGISLNRATTDSLSTDPRSAYITVSGNMVSGVPSWAGIDTHGGANLTITGNTVYNCRFGINCVRAEGVSEPNGRYAPQNISITGNVVDSGVTDGSRAYGICVSGANANPVVLGTPTEVSEGITITGNTVRGHGLDTSSTNNGAIYLNTTRGAVVVSNTIINPSPYGINFDYNNWGFSCAGNTIQDAWSNNVSDASGIACRTTSGYAYGTVASNSLVDGPKTATYLNRYAFRMCATGSGAVRFSPGYSDAVVAELFDSAALVTRSVPRIKDFGAKGDGSTADDTAFSSAVSGTPAGSELVIDSPASYYKLTSAWTISKALKITGQGLPEIKQATSNTLGINVTADNVTLDGLKITGPQSASSQTTEGGIRCYGSSAASPRRNLTVRNCVIGTWGQLGIDAKWLEGLTVENNRVTDIYLAGIRCISVLGGSIRGNRIDTIVSGGQGIRLQRGAVTSLSTDPRTARLAVVGNLISGVPTGVGIYGMGIEQCSIASNQIYDTLVGIRLLPAQNDSAADTYAARVVSIADNTIASGVTDGTRSYGIQVTGAEQAVLVLGTPVDVCTGISISGNTIIGHGDETASASAGIYFTGTAGTVCSNNTLVEPAPFGISSHYNNWGFTLSGNTVRDAWSNTWNDASGYACLTSAGFQFGTLNGNTLTSGSKSATYKNVYLFRGNTTTDSAISYTPGYSEHVTAEVLDSTNFLVSRTKRFLTQSGVPTAGTWAQGDIVWNDATSTTLSTPIGWTCTAAGTPGTWTPFYRGVSIITGSDTWDPGTINAGASETKDVSVASVGIGAQAVASLTEALPAGWTLTAAVTSTSNVRVVLTNNTGSNADPAASSTVAVKVFQP